MATYKTHLAHAIDDFVGHTKSWKFSQEFIPQLIENREKSVARAERIGWHCNEEKAFVGFINVVCK